MYIVNEEAVQSWLINHLAEQLGVAPQEINVQKPFTEYGLDSIVGVSLAGDLEEWLGLQLYPTLLWDYPTVAMLTQRLTAEFRASCKPAWVATTASLAAADSTAMDSVNAEQLLANLDALSDADVDTLLGNLLVTQDA